MGVFGQVWLWSLVAFAIGAALSWLWLARPLRRQVEDLEWQLEEARSAGPAAAAGGAPVRATPAAVPGPRGDQPTRWDATGPPTPAAPGFGDAAPIRPQPAASRPPEPEPPWERAERRMPGLEPPNPLPSPARLGQPTPAEPPRRPAPPPAAPGPMPRRGQPAAERAQPPRVFGGVLPPRDIRSTETTTQLGRAVGADDVPELPVEEPSSPTAGEPVRTAEPDPRHRRPTAPPEPNVAEPERPPRTTEAAAPPSRISGAFDLADQVLAPAEVTDGHGWPESNAEDDEVEDTIEDQERPVSAAAEARPAGAAEPRAVDQDADEFERPRSLFEPLVDPEEIRRRANPPNPVMNPLGSGHPAPDQPSSLTGSAPQPPTTGPVAPTGQPRAERSAAAQPTADRPVAGGPNQPAGPPPPPPAPARPSGPAESARPPAHEGTPAGPATGGPPFGPGSALPQPDGSAPSPDFRVKAFLPGRRYLTADSPEFERSRAQIWFRSPIDAQRAGFVAAARPS